MITGARVRLYIYSQT